MQPKAKLVLGVGCLFLIALLLRGACDTVSSADGQDVLVGRVWLDHVPTKPDEHCDLFVTVAADGGKGNGVFSRASQFEGTFSVFEWKEPQAGKLEIVLLQEKSKHTLKYEAKACDKDGFDYCLELTGAPKGPRQYVSKRGWELGAERLPELSAELDNWRSGHLP